LERIEAAPIVQLIDNEEVTEEDWARLGVQRGKWGGWGETFWIPNGLVVGALMRYGRNKRSPRQVVPLVEEVLANTALLFGDPKI
jgi:hypothetical protein